MSGTREAQWADPERDPVEITAADWVGRLSNSTVSLEETLAWQAWMKADARHAAAFHRFEQISRSLRKTAPPPPPSRWQLEHDAYDGSVPLSDWNARRRPPFAAAIRNLRPAMAAALVIVAAAVGWVTMATLPMPWDPASQTVTTRIGENRVVGLADGSTVTLGGATRLEWSFTNTERSLRLIDGEALFTVSRDPARPFRVRAGDATVVALGTEFNVRRASDRTVVVVTNGRVMVEPVTRVLPVAVLQEFNPKLRPVHLDAGEQTIAGSAGIEKASPMEDVAAATAWRTGRLSFRLQPLRYVLEDVNRYVDKPIVAADERVSSLVVSGTVIGDSIGGWIESLEHAFGLVALEEDDRIVLRSQ